MSDFSFRDPGGALTVRDGRVWRIVNESGAADLECYLGSRAIAGRIAAGRAVRAVVAGGEERERLLSDAGFRAEYERVGGRAVVEHDRIEFPTQPCEWPPEMLYQAGVETIELAVELLDEGLGLKDATPLNVLFRGPDAVFVDALSIERRRPGDERWLGYAQFVRNFILPLAVNRDFGVPLSQVFLTRRDGLEPEEVYRMLGPVRRLSRAYFGTVTMPRLLGARQKVRSAEFYQDRVGSDAEKARFVLRAMYGGLRRALDRVRPRGGAVSVWSDYMSGNNNYSDAQFREKEAFVGAALNDAAPRRVLDVGANNGHFSAMAARSGGEVVAVDYDPAVAGQIFRSARAGGLRIQPVVADLTRPTPAVGWSNAEFPSLLDRLSGRFDTVLMLAVIHHMLVTERVPLDEIVGLAARLTSAHLIIEYVSPADSMFRRLARGREHLHAGLTAEVFEAALGRRFEILRRKAVEGGGRILYLARKRA